MGYRPSKISTPAPTPTPADPLDPCTGVVKTIHASGRVWYDYPPIHQLPPTTPTGARLAEIATAARSEYQRYNTARFICSQCGALDLSTRLIFGSPTCRPCRLAYNRHNQTDIGAEIADDPILVMTDTYRMTMTETA